MADENGQSLTSSDDRRGVLAWFTANHVAANVVMVFVLAAGVLSLLFIKTEVFQDIDPDLIRVSVSYPGASPSEVEESICQRVEEAIDGIEGVSRVLSVARDGIGTVVAELKDFATDSDVLDEIKQAVDRIEDFPPRYADKPNVVDVDARVQVISVVIYGDAPLRTLKELAERAQDELTALPEVSLVEITGVPRYEISIEVSELALRRYGLSFHDVGTAVRRSSLDLPGGRIKSAGGDILISTKGQHYVGRDFEAIVLMTGQDGTKVHLSDIACVIDGFEDTDIATYFDGKPAVFLKVFRIGDQDALDVETAVEQYLNQASLPEAVQMTTWFNRASYLRGRIELLVRNSSIGLALVFLCLTLLLDLRLAFWTTLGIPISFMGAFFLMPMFGISINMLSLFAMLIVLGIVVDDAIVVGENIFAYRQQGDDSLVASIKGVREMVAPVVMTIATTIVAFLPLLYTKGELGKILWPVPAVVICVLVISLLEAIFILPAHLAAGKRRRTTGAIARIQGRVRASLQWVIDQPYTWTLHRVVRWRYATVATAAAVFTLMIGYVAGGHIKFSFLPQMDADNVWATLSMPQGTPLEQTKAVVRRLEQGIEQVRRELDEQRPEISGEVPSIIRHVSTSVGTQPFTKLAGGGPGALVIDDGGGHLAEVNVELMSAEYRDLSSKFIAQQWRERVGELPGISSLSSDGALRAFFLLFFRNKYVRKYFGDIIILLLLF